MTWSRIHGHDSLVDAFQRAYSRGRLAHAYLFTGPPGVGKGLFARELARALLCEARPPGSDLAACDHCDSCNLVSAGTHPDLYAVCRPEQKNEFPIELMQELCGGFSLKTARGHGKVAILEDVDDLNGPSANCFLKTLEEPPPRSVFVLVGTNLDQQLATIRSRCQVVRFAPLHEAAMRDVLAEHGIADPDLRDRLVRLAAGSPGQALALADESLWQCRHTLLVGISGSNPDAVSLARGMVEFAEEAGKDLAPQRRRVALVLHLMAAALTDALLVRLGVPPRSCGTDERLMLHALAERTGEETILALLERCVDAEIQIGRYIQLAVVIEGLMDAIVAAIRTDLSTVSR